VLISVRLTGRPNATGADCSTNESIVWTERPELIDLWDIDIDDSDLLVDKDGSSIDSAVLGHESIEFDNMDEVGAFEYPINEVFFLNSMWLLELGLIISWRYGILEWYNAAVKICNIPMY